VQDAMQCLDAAAAERFLREFAGIDA